MRRTSLSLVALAALVSCCRSPPRAPAVSPTGSTFPTASSPKASRSGEGRPSTSARSRRGASGAATSAPAREPSSFPTGAALRSASTSTIEAACSSRAGPPGGGYVYNARTGADIAQYSFASAATFVNDVVVTRDAALVHRLDAGRSSTRCRIGRHGRLGPARAVPLTGDIVYGRGFNTNGIDATPNGRTLVIVQSNTGKLFKVNRRGVTDEIDLGGATVTSGDGILLDGRTLYVVRNTLNLIAVVRLRHDLASGRIVREITHPDFDVPTTIDDLGRNLFAVNARFTTPPEPDTEYWVTRVRK